MPVVVCHAVASLVLVSHMVIWMYAYIVFGFETFMLHCRLLMHAVVSVAEDDDSLGVGCNVTVTVTHLTHIAHHRATTRPP